MVGVFYIFKKRAVFYSVRIKIREKPCGEPGVNINNRNTVSQKKTFQEKNFFIGSKLQKIRGYGVRIFFAEGQYFYFLKRRTFKTFWRCPVEKMDYYVLPTPDDEIAYGNVK